MAHGKPDLQASVDVIGEPWRESAYYRDAEQWTFLFWDPAHPFRPWFDRLDPRATLELACGHGRHAERVAPLAQRLVLMDIHEDNLAFCRERLAEHPHVEVLRNSGYDFHPVEDDSLTAIFCYDAMVHFSPDLVAAYLKDTARVLVHGGMALYHHSNHEPDDPQRHYGLNPHARNRMTLPLFRALTEEAGLQVADARPLDWGGVPDLDGLTLVRRA